MKILIIRFSSLGDIVLTEPVVRNIRLAYPKSQIDYLTKPAFESFIATYLNVDNVLTEYKKVKELREIAKNNYDIVIDLHSKLNSFIAKFFISGAKSVTYKKQRSLRKKIVNKTTTLAIDSTVDLYFSALKEINIECRVKNPQININHRKDLLPNKNRLNVVLFPGATHETKRIPTYKLMELIKKLDNADTNFYLMGSKGEKQLTSEIKAQLNDNCYDLAGIYSIVELVEAVSEADVVITNDSGPMHIAAALRLPQIAFFGSTNIKLGFRPLNPKAKVISVDMPCSPCTLHGTKECPKKHYDCMNKINIDEVVEIFKELL